MGRTAECCALRRPWFSLPTYGCVTRTTLSDEFGLVLQAGTDIALGDSGLGLTIDAKRYFVDTTARWYAGDTLAIETEHKLDPWVLSAGVSYRF